MALRSSLQGRAPLQILQQLRVNPISSLALFRRTGSFLRPVAAPQTQRRMSAAESSSPAPEHEEAAPPPTAEPAAASSGTSFVELGVDKRLAANLAASGISAPTDVQLASIPEILTGANVAMQCYTGSGKTLAFLLPVLSMAVQRSEAEWKGVTRKTAGQAGSVQAVIVTPSRELAMQIVRVAQSILPEAAKNAVQQCIGGANGIRQREALKEWKPILVVGTPGRLAELSRDGSLQTHRTGILVLDEADQLLAPQFREEMVRVTEHTGKKCTEGRQTIVVSATLTQRVLTLSEPWCPQPKQIFVGARPAEDDASVAAAGEEAEKGGEGAGKRGPQWGWNQPVGGFAPPGMGSAGGFGNRDAAPAIAPGLSHYYVTSAPQHRIDTLRRAIHALDVQRALVFMNFQQRLADAEAKLAARKMKVGSLHGEMTKQERRSTLDAFRTGKLRALLVSDVAARGLDIPECDAVFNLELPTDAAHYAHRAGRTGRAGREGMVVTVASGGETFVVERLGARLGVKIAEVELTGGEAVVGRDSAAAGGDGEGAMRRVRGRDSGFE